MKTVTHNNDTCSTLLKLHSAVAKLCLTVACAVLPALSAAHDLVLVPEPDGNLTVRFGHVGDWQMLTRERLLELRVVSETSNPKSAPMTLKPSGLNLTATGVATAGTAGLVAARYDNGLWVVMPGLEGKPEYFNTSKAMLPQAKSAMAAIKFAKGLYATADDKTVYKQKVGHLIEIIPQRNPASVKAGEKLAVQVQFNGKPLANAGVEITDSATQTTEGQAKFKTNAAGIAEVPIERAGVNVVSVDFEKANDGSLGKAMKALPVDKVAMIATYAFQVR